MRGHAADGRLLACADRLGDRLDDATVTAMAGRYDQSALNVYGAEDDEEMDAILDAIERANQASAPRTAVPNPTLEQRR